MTVSDGVAVGAITGLAGFCGWLVKRMASAYFDHIPKQTEAMQQMADASKKLVDRFELHDEASAQAHTDASKTQKQVCRSLKAVCAALSKEPGSSNGKATRS
jgi:hypothetical protein